MADLTRPPSKDPEVLAAQERVKQYREADAEHRADQAATSMAESLVLDEVGAADFHQGRRLVRSYVEGLPESERAAIAKELKLDGSDLLDPDQLRGLARKAIGEIPSAPEAIDAELEQIRKRMREDRKGYFADDKAQLRYRALLRAKG